ncbi:MAG: rhodanese-like domain-containing protein [Rhodospirillaceae bacterium]|jgi:2-methylaconitate isomerase|nr:rhodanese-like domain-containing protein [Rhodospirillaceae bacterium]MBT4219131.1 rhodanese-like domain-containing protein [Rhodospirillaceae bacterium]MBT4464352.1 rhodanese-like domain-containing protein [Rhodospirillaceae bacterium]MBT5014035.1 rhodanese-like domain-containing protein [Rhodospirillaceae bacterium]MBT5309673.1 rhodanese-like domain-containing protein [Rhodospirillaceae bacterium]
MKLQKGYQKLLEEAEKVVEAVDVNDAMEMLGRDDVVFVDIREIQELQREGMVPDAFHAPRGLLEFWVDPDCSYYKEELTSGKNLVLYCSLGWRSALAAKSLMEMGVANVKHMAGGIKMWKQLGGTVQEKKKKSPK